MDLIRVLYISGGIMHRGGIESYMMNYYRHLDRSKVQIDFVVHGFEKGVYDDEIKSMGGNIYNIPVKSKNYFGNIKALMEVFNSNTYKIVHSHMDAMNMVVLKTAKKCGIPVRISHSHNTQHLTNNGIKYLLNEYARKKVKKYATHYFACSEPAARWLYGNQNVNRHRVVYIKNAIDLTRYRFDKFTRDEVRDQFELNGYFVVGHVGRFDYQKNHHFLLDIFSELLKENPNSRLVLIGDGGLRERINQKIIQLNIENKVILVGVRDDVHRLINAFDVFCLPSHFEGLGIVLIEAQMNGLKCITSYDVPREVDISGETKFIDLNDPTALWVNSLLEGKKYSIDREIKVCQFIDAGYSISHEAAKLQDIYMSLLGELT